jgi:hypothetical protein
MSRLSWLNTRNPFANEGNPEEVVVNNSQNESDRKWH